MDSYWMLTSTRDWIRTGFLDEFMNGFVKDSYMDPRFSRLECVVEPHMDSHMDS